LRWSVLVVAARVEIPFTYRSSGDARLHERRALLLAAEPRERSRAARVDRVAARRIAGIASGICALVTSALVVCSAWWMTLSVSAGPVLVLGAAATVGVYVSVLWLSRLALVVRRLERAASDLRGDVSRLEAASERRRRTAEWVSSVWFETLGNGLPLAGFGLLFPLLLHRPFFGPGADFDRWVQLSTWFVGHSHLVVAFLSIRYAHRLAKGTAKRGWFGSSLVTLGLAAAVAIVPSVILAPPLVLVTGIVPLPIAFLLASRRAARDRVALRRAGVPRSA